MRGTGGVVGDVAIQLAQGASLGAALTNSLKGATLGALLGPSVLFAGTMVGVLKTIKAIVDQSGVLERGLKRIAGLQQIQGQMEVLMRSTVQAAARMKELQAFAAKSPFNLSDIAEGNRQLQALTQGALAGAKGMQLIGDAAAATGQSFSETAAGVGKLYSAISSGRSLERVLFILQRDGVVTQELADKLEVAKESGMGVSDMLAILTSHLERANGAMSKEMESLIGLNKRLDETTKLMEQVAAEPFVKAQENSIKTTIKLLDSMTPLIGRISKEMQPVMGAFSGLKNWVVSNTVATKTFASALGGVYDVIKPLVVGLAAVAIGNVAGGLLGAGRGALKLKSAVSAGKGGAAYKAGVGKSDSLGVQAASALAEGALFSAASFKAQSVWAKVAAGAVNMNTAAMNASKASAGGYSVAMHAVNLALSVVTEGATAVIGVVKRLGVAMATTMLGPLTIFATLAIAAGFAIQSWADETAGAAQATMDLAQRTAAINRELREQIKNIKTVNDLKAVESNLEGKIKAQEANVAALGSRPLPTTRMVSGGSRSDNQREVTSDAAGLEYDMELKLRKAELARLVAQQKGLPGKGGLINEEREAYMALALKQREIQYERLIAGIRQKGGETAASEAQKELSILKAQLVFAKEKAKVPGAAGQVGLLEAETNLERFYSLKAETRKGYITERAVNDRILAGDTKGAQGLQDNAALASMRSDYEKAGMSPGQADSDFKANLMAQAATTAPRIVADSLQAIGGGGGSAGGNPMAAAMERIRVIGETQVKYLGDILGAINKQKGVQ